MSEFIYHIHYRPGFKIGKANGLSECLGEEKSAIDTDFFDEGQLLDLKNNNIVEEEDVANVELEGIDLAILEKTNRLWVVLQEHRLEVRYQHRDSQVAGHWERH